MATPALVASLAVAALHVVFFVLESVLWTTATGRRIFGQSRDDAQTTRVLALNQGAYNAGVAALLAWAVLTDCGDTATALLAFIVAMGVVGGVTAKPTILALQAAPAALALALLHLA